MKKPATEPASSDNAFSESHFQIVVSKLKEKVEQLEKEIEERKKAEEMLVEAAKEWATTFDAMADGVSIHTADFRIINANAALCQMLGKSKDEIIDHSCHSVFHGLDTPPEDCPLKHTMDAGKQEHAERFEPSLGRWLSISTSPVFDEQGSLINCIRVTRDITEQRQAQVALEKAHRRNEIILSCAGEGIYGLDHDGTVTFINPAAAEMFGYPLEGLVGRSSHDLWHHSKPDGSPYPKEECPAHSAVREGLAKQVMEDVYWRSDGSSFPVAYVATPILEPDRQQPIGAVVVFKDISKRRQREEQIQRQLQHLSALHHIDLAITSSLDLRVTMDIILDQVATELKMDAAAILLLNPHFQVLEYAAGRGFHTRALQHTHLRLGECFAGRAAMERRIISVHDLAGSPGEFVRAPLLAGEKFTTYFAAPLITKGQVKGVLELFSRTTFEADSEWLGFLETLATQAAIAIDSAFLFDDLQRSHTDLMLAYDTTLEGWSRAMDLRDKETEGHTRRVSEMTLRLARELGVGDAELVHMYRGALLHDIGKIGIPDNILLKPGKLTDEEEAIMKRHPVYAYELLYPITFLRPAIDIPYCHHEMWNGKGYPRGLEDTGIPLAARIFSVIDVWDALRSDRPYRPAWSEEKVRKYIQSLAGIQFDPKVVDVFLAMEW